MICLKENAEYLELFIIVDNTKFQQGQENLLFLQIFLTLLKFSVINDLCGTICLYHLNARLNFQSVNL